MTRIKEKLKSLLKETIETLTTKGSYYLVAHDGKHVEFNDIYWYNGDAWDYSYALNQIIKNKNAINELPKELVKEIIEVMVEAEKFGGIKLKI